MRPIYQRLFGSTDIYAGINADPSASPPDGWHDHSPMFRELAVGAKLIIEVGSWLGKSAIALANAAPEAEILCVDTWLGAKEMWTDHSDATRYGQLRLVHGYPTIYFEFLHNIVNAGKQHQITPMPMPSSIAMDFLNDLGVRPDLIYIDGSHSYRDVRSDIESASELCPKILCGDDYGIWPGVKQAVDSQPFARTVVGCFWFSKR